MNYPQKIVKLPADMKVGSEVGVVGEGNDIFWVTKIVRKNGKVDDVELSCGCREPLAKIYLLRGRSHEVACKDKTSWIDVATGECDVCSSKFSDSCMYHTKIGSTEMVCDKCHRKEMK